MATAAIPKTKVTGGSWLLDEPAADSVFTPEDFTALVPVEIQRGRTKTVQWFPVSTEPARFSAVGVKASLAVNDSLIRK